MPAGEPSPIMRSWELLLTYVIPRKDTKPIAKALLRRHKSLTAVLDQPTERLEETDRIGPQSSVFITLIRSCIERYLEQRVEQRRSRYCSVMV